MPGLYVTLSTTRGVVLQLANFDQTLLKWCTLHCVNLGIAQWTAASALIMLLNLQANSRFKLLDLTTVSPETLNP